MKVNALFSVDGDCVQSGVDGIKNISIADGACKDWPIVTKDNGSVTKINPAFLMAIEVRDENS